MNLLLRPRVGLFFLLAVPLLVGCTQGEVVQNPEISFDGGNCRYKGPEVVSEGNLAFVFKNLSDKPSAHLHVSLLTEGTTWQDILDLAAKGPIRSPPSGVRDLYYVSREGDAEVYPLKPGTHAVFCVIHGVNGWPAAALEVES